MAETIQVHDFSREEDPKPFSRVKSLLEKTKDKEVKVIMPASAGPRLRDMVKKQGWSVAEEKVKGQNLHATLKKS